MASTVRPIRPKTAEMLAAEARLGQPLELFLYRRRWDERATLYELGDELGISFASAYRWLYHFNLAGRVSGPKPPRPEPGMEPATS